MKILYKAFDQERLVEVELHNMVEGEAPEATLWVERSEDYYALMSSYYKGKKVAIVKREKWLNS